MGFMEQETTNKKARQVYRVQGFTCAGCAGKFERNVKALPGVQDASVNFGAAKVTVIGQASIEELEQAGAFENLKITPDQQQGTLEKMKIWKLGTHVWISGLLFLLGFVLQNRLGEDELGSSWVFGASIVIGGYNLFIKGLKNLIKMEFDMNVLMTIAILGAAALGEWSEGAMVVFLFAISENLERFSMDQARASIRTLMDLSPKKALVRRGMEEIMLKVDEIQIGDILIVKPGQKLAMDGVIVKGQSTVNQAAITGESVPVAKTIGDEVFAGTLNEDGILEIEVTKVASDTTLARIIHLVEEAQAERAPTQQFVDRFAQYYTPAIIVLAIGIAVFPPLLTGADWGEWIYRALSLLVVGCPCALVISTPIAIVTAIGSAARNGVLIKGGAHLEEAGHVKAIAFDKTGTLTQGTPTVTDFMTYGTDRRVALRIAASLEQYAQHPLAIAVMHLANQEKVELSQSIEQFCAIPGKGVQGTLDDQSYVLGSPSYITEQNIPMSDPVHHRIGALQQQGKTVLVLANTTGKSILALIAVADALRPEVSEMMKQLKKLGINQTVMLTGDNRGVAEAIAQQAGIDEVKAELLPQDKLNEVKQLRNQYDHIAMIGDGVNDAPALAASSVGIAMGGSGTDTALETADITLMSDDLSKLPYLMRLSQKSLRIIKQNITFSLVIKLMALLLVIPNWLTLWMAVFADMGGTLLVTVNSLRLIRRSRN